MERKEGASKWRARKELQYARSMQGCGRDWLSHSEISRQKENSRRQISSCSLSDDVAKLAREGQVCVLRFEECLHSSYRSVQLIN